MAAAPLPAEVELYLHRHIPLSSAMGVRLVRCGREGVTHAAELTCARKAAAKFEGD